MFHSHYVTLKFHIPYLSAPQRGWQSQYPFPIGQLTPFDARTSGKRPVNW